MKPHIHFHSDCSFFAGCENMLVNFFQNEQFMQDYRVTFSYRRSTPYETGFRSRVTRQFDTIPLGLLDTDLFNNISFKPARLALKVISRLLLLKYWFVLWNTLVLYRAFGRSKIDVLHINNGGYPGAYSCMSAVFAARLRGIRKIVYVVNNIAFPYISLYRWLDYPLDRIVAKTVSVFVTGSTYAGRKLTEVLRLPSSQITTIHNGISPRIVTETRQEVLKRLGIQDGRLLIAVVANLEERKGHIYLFKALKSLKDQGYESRLPLVLIEGTGTTFDDLMRFVRKEGLENDIKFIGTEANVFNLIDAVDIIALPSISNEDFPNVILEAMSFGKTVIASRLAGTPEQVDHMQSGILVKPKDVEGLAQAIWQVVEDETSRKRLGKNALQRFNDRFVANISVANYVSLYLKLLEANNR